MVNSNDPLTKIHAEYEAGKSAFEHGDYRRSLSHLETANSLVESGSQLGGEIQIWLVTAYEAMGRRAEALALCRRISKHPDYATRKQAGRILYILEAPRLVTRPEWLTQIPDLSRLETGDRDYPPPHLTAPVVKRKPNVEKPKFQLEPADRSQVNTRDNRFIWIALAAILLLLGSTLGWH